MKMNHPSRMKKSYSLSLHLPILISEFVRVRFHFPPLCANTTDPILYQKGRCSAFETFLFVCLGKPANLVKILAFGS